MADEVREFVIGALREMSYDVAEVTDETPLGPAGLDLESLAVAELVLRVEDTYKVVFADDEADRMVSMTVGELVEEVAGRLPAKSGATASE
jgi:acyl carrier protein